MHSDCPLTGYCLLFRILYQIGVTLQLVKWNQHQITFGIIGRRMFPPSTFCKIIIKTYQLTTT